MRAPLGLLPGPVIDVVVYWLAAGLGGASPQCAETLSFAAAVIFGYLPWLGSQPDLKTGGWSFGLALHLAVVTMLAFFVRSGALIALMSAVHWPGQTAIGAAAIAAAFIVHPGYAHCASYRHWRLGGGAGWRTGAIGLIVVAAALRLVYCGGVELLPEEAYYWNYARHLDIGYLDHPPMVAWLIGAGTRAFGGAEFGVRAGALCSGAIATFFTYRLTRNLFGSPSALVAAVLVQTLPFFFLAGMLMTPDAPLTAAWAASLFYLERALVAGRRTAWWGAGLCLGLGLLCKYTIVLMGLSALIFMVIDSRARRWSRRVDPYGAALLALAVFSPVIVWNAHNEWVSFLFQTSHRLADRPQFALHKLVASALVLLTPTGLAGAAMVLTRRAPPCAESGPADDESRGRGWRFLQVATLTPLAIFAAFSFRHEVKLDWTGAPWVAAVPLLACGIVELSLLRRAWVPTLLAMLLVYGAGLYDLTWGIPGVGYGKHAELVPIGWRELGAQIDRIAESVGSQTGRVPLVVGMDRYAIASELAFYAPDQRQGVARSSSGHLFGQVGLMYERWFPPAVEKGRNLLLVSWNREDLDSDRLAPAVERLDPIEEGVLTRADAVIRRYYYRVAYGYRGVTRRAVPGD